MNNEPNKLEKTLTLTPEQQNQVDIALNKANENFLQIVNLDKLEENSVLVFRINEDNIELMMALPYLCEKYKDILKSKKIATLIISPDEKMEVLREQDMERLGWIKKDKNRIITLS